MRSLHILRELDAQPSGDRSRSWDFSDSILDLWAEHGLLYSPNLMDDIRPNRHANGVVELPVQWVLDDASHFWFEGRTCWNKKIPMSSRVRELWQSEFLALSRLGALFLFTVHPQFIGRPSRLAMLDDFLALVTSHEDVWLTSAAHFASATDLELPKGF